MNYDIDEIPPRSKWNADMKMIIDIVLIPALRQCMNSECLWIVPHDGNQSKTPKQRLSEGLDNESQNLVKSVNEEDEQSYVDFVNNMMYLQLLSISGKY